MSKKLGNMVKEARTARGLTQAQLAAKVAGVSTTDVGKIERGEKEPTQDILKKMAKVLGVTQKSLLDAATGSTSALGKKSGSVTVLTLTAAEKRLVQFYRNADSKTKKAAVNLLQGDANAIELISAFLSAKGSSGSGNSVDPDLISSLLSGKSGNSSESEKLKAVLDILGKLSK